MKNVTITTGAHPQNGVQVKMINILDSQFVFSDTRGRNTARNIDLEFAKKIIDSIPAATYYPERLPSVNIHIKLSWTMVEGNGVRISLHSYTHIYTSKVFSLIQ